MPKNDERGDLRSECLGRSHADFGSGVREQRAGGFARDHGADHVANGQRLRAFLFGFALGGESIGGFARLRNDDGQGVGGNDGIAIAELAAVIDFDGQTRQAFDDKLARQAGMPTGAAGNDFDLLERFEIGFGNIDFIQEDAAAFLADAAEHGVFDSARLLKHFFEHEVFIAAFFGHDGIPQNVRDLAADDFAIDIHQLDAAGGEDGNIAIVEEDHVAGVAENGGDIGGDEKFVLSQDR